MAERDWRLTNQEQYLGGAVFVRKRWTQPREDWITIIASSVGLSSGSLTRASLIVSRRDIRVGSAGRSPPYYWVCEACFEDFRDLLRFIVAEA